ATTDQSTTTPARMPVWAQKLLKRPLVEIRRGISFGYDAPKEESSVVALTVPSGRYIDIRWQLNPTATAIRGSVKQSSSFPGYATAGMSYTRMPRGTESCPAYESTIHVQWEHSIDSSRAFDTDGADVYLLSNGDTMEIGYMMLRGEWRMFKEYWLDGATRETDTAYVAMELVGLATDNGVSEEGEKGEKGEKGMVIRVGSYCQGIFQNTEELWVERWKVDETGDWKMDSRSTRREDATLPCQWATGEERKLGDSTELGNRVWRVVETSY
ncbi:uncharacterized protein A1O9_05178, partial [Exophiala aquamarina CBS 119918]